MTRAQELNKVLDNTITKNQHGFRNNLSCPTQLVTVVHEVAEGLDTGATVHAAVLDFSKAFDKVPHHLIIGKLLSANVPPCLIKWIVSFLSNGKQRVVLDGEGVDTVAVTSGVPQDGVLGPALFILFINDIIDCVKYSKIKLFADDTIIYRTVASSVDGQKLQHDLDGLF